MSTIMFPTRVGGDLRGRPPTPGYPEEARPCRCGDRRLVVDGECMWCGLWPGHVIRATWASQALRCARGQTDVALEHLTDWVQELLA